MTNQTLLKNLYDIEKYMNDKNYIDSYYKLQDIIKSVKDDIIKSDSKVTGKSQQYSAFKRICKYADREEFKIPFVCGGFQWFCSGYHFVGIPEENKISWPEERKEKFNLNCLKCIPEKATEELKLPDIKKLSAYIKIEKSKGNKRIIYSFGGLIVNAQLLIDMLQAMPGCIAYRVQGNNTSVIKFICKESGMIGGLCPVIIGPNEIEKYKDPTKF